MHEQPHAARLAAVGFSVPVLLFFYGILFPFDFAFSAGFIRDALSHAGLLPYWELDRHRIHGVPDMVGSILLTIPFVLLAALGAWTGAVTVKPSSSRQRRNRRRGHNGRPQPLFCRPNRLYICSAVAARRR